MNFAPKPLTFTPSALEPILSEKTMQFHHGKHLQAYVNNLNNLIPGSKFEYADLKTIITEAPMGGLFNNAAQVWNHEFFFEQLTPQNNSKPIGKLSIAINQTFGSFENFKSEMSQAATSHFGSGWIWLTKKTDGNLEIIKCNNAENPLRNGLKPLFTIDVWEHAYYLDYQNRRADYINNIWNIINWDLISHRI